MERLKQLLVGKKFEIFFYSWIMFVLYAGLVLFAPTSLWFKYLEGQEVVPTKEVFAIGEEVFFISTRTVRFPMSFNWFEVMFCADPDSELFSRFSELDTSSPLKLPTFSYEVGTWNWDSSLPQRPADCYVEGYIRARVGVITSLTSQYFKTDVFQIR